VARNRQRSRRPRSDPAGGDPLFPQDAGSIPPPISGEPPVAFAGDDDDDGRDAASQAFGKAGPVEQERRPTGNRVFDFLRASWAELQRVQWPDRQQVAQATGVVLGFVVITGIFLGIADFLAGKLINFII
jgi:preprotein translocase SecE subunit